MLSLAGAVSTVGKNRQHVEGVRPFTVGEVGKKGATALNLLNSNLGTNKVVGGRVTSENGEISFDLALGNGAVGNIRTTEGPNMKFKTALCKGGKKTVACAAFASLDDTLVSCSGVLSNGKTSTDISDDATHIVPGARTTIIVTPPSTVFLVSKDTANGAMHRSQSFTDIPHFIDRILRVQWCDSSTSDFFRILGTTALRGELTTTLLTVSVQEMTISEKVSIHTPGVPSCAGVSPDGVMWCIGCTNSKLTLRNTVSRTQVTSDHPTQGTATTILVSSTLVIVSGGDFVNFYDYGLNPLKVLSGASPGHYTLPSHFFFNSSVAAMFLSGSSLAVVGRGGPVAICSLSGGSTHAHLAKNLPLQKTINLLRNLTKSDRLTLISEVVCRAYARSDFTFAKGVLTEFAPGYIPVGMPKGVDGDVFTSIFRRFYVKSLQEEDVCNGFYMATTLQASSWFDELYYIASSHDPALAEVCLSHGTRALRTHLKAEKSFLLNPPQADYSRDAMAALLQQPSLPPHTSVVLARLITLYKGYPEGHTYLKDLMEKAALEGRDEDAAFFRASLPSRELVAACS